MHSDSNGEADQVRRSWAQWASELGLTFDKLPLMVRFEIGARVSAETVERYVINNERRTKKRCILMPLTILQGY